MATEFVLKIYKYNFTLNPRELAYVSLATVPPPWAKTVKSNNSNNNNNNNEYNQQNDIRNLV